MRQRVIDAIREICELYGYVPLDTPAVERKDVLYDGMPGEPHDQIVEVTIKKPHPGTRELDKKSYVLRFDLTVPLARFVASEKSALTLPFRRYQVAPVWRPREGRMEFTMFDLDAVGVESEVADTEIIVAMCEILRKLDPGPFKVRYSSREILTSLFRLAGVPQAHRTHRVFEIISLRDKIDVGHALLHETSVTPRQIKKIKPFIAIRSSNRGEVISQLRDFFADARYADDGIAVVERMSNQLDALGYGNDVVEIDLSVTRSFEYYTGPVFEATLTRTGDSEPIFFGGRYDNLVERFGAPRLPATGASIHVDRLMNAITRRTGSNDQKRASARVFVANTEPSMVADVLTLARDLRDKRIETQLYAGEAKTLDDQLDYARKYGIPIVVACEQEGVRITSTTSTSEWKPVARAAVVAAVQTMLNELDARGAATPS